MGINGTIREQLAERGFELSYRTELTDIYTNEKFEDISVIDSVKWGWHVEMKLDSNMPEKQQEAYINEYKELKKIIA